MSAKRFDDPQKLAEAVQKASQKAMDRAVLSTAQRVVQHIQVVIIPGQPRQPVDRGVYKAAWRAKAVKGGAIVYNSSPQAPLIEYGVRATNVKIGRKMIKALAEWARRKGLVKTPKPKAPRVKADKSLFGKLKRYAIKKKILKKKKPVPPPDVMAERVAWGIAKGIKQRGIFGPHGMRILEKAKEVIQKFIKEEIAREFEKMRPQ